MTDFFPIASDNGQSVVGLVILARHPTTDRGDDREDAHHGKDESRHLHRCGHLDPRCLECPVQPLQQLSGCLVVWLSGCLVVWLSGRDTSF